jgi:manganese-dependent ADP-ribose/CDP-alcohol diphosphatase
MYLHRLLTDVQYADVEDGWNFHKTQQRFYRHAICHLQEALDEWRQTTQAKTKEISFVINLGDLIDGKNKMVHNSKNAWEKIIQTLEPFQKQVAPVHHLLGNHELYNFPVEIFERDLLWEEAKKQKKNIYYDFIHPQAPGIKFVILNTYGITSLGRQPNDPIFIEARKIIRSVNKNDNLNSPAGLRGVRQRFVEYNGAIDEKQLIWLQEILSQASEKKEQVLIFSHIPIHPNSCNQASLLWNYEQVLEIIRENSTVVRAVFSGHFHQDGYAFDSGVHYIVMDAVLECDPTTNAFASVDLHSDCLVINGYGKVPTRNLPFYESRRTVRKRVRTISS